MQEYGCLLKMLGYFNCNTKLSKGKTVSMEGFIQICKTHECDISDIMELIPDEETANAQKTINK